MERRGQPASLPDFRRAKAPANFIDSRRRESSCSLPPICGIRVFRELMLCLKKLHRLKTTRVVTETVAKRKVPPLRFAPVGMTELGCVRRFELCSIVSDSAPSSTPARQCRAGSLQNKNREQAGLNPLPVIQLRKGCGPLAAEYRFTLTRPHSEPQSATTCRSWATPWR